MTSSTQEIETIESWTANMLLVAFLRKNPSRYIKQEAQAALRGWAKREDTTTRNILKTIIRCKADRGELLRRTYEHLKEGTA